MTADKAAAAKDTQAAKSNAKGGPLAEAHALIEGAKVLTKRLEQMSSMKGKVADVVFDRVKADYSEKLEAVREKLRPLAVKMVDDLESKSSEVSQLEKQIDEIKIQLEEIEFRHQLGEYPAPKSEALKLEKGKDLSSLEKKVSSLKNEIRRYEDAIKAGGFSKEELKKPQADRHMAQEKVEKTEDMEEAKFWQEAESDDAATIATAQDNMVLDEPGIAIPESEGSQLSSQSFDAASTMLINRASLVLVEGSNPPRPMQLQVDRTTIGMASDNDLCLQGRGIAPYHAVIELSPQGNAIRAIGGAVIVGGEKVIEHLLVDQEQVKIGSLTFIYRETMNS